jgi:hypothetical protein
VQVASSLSDATTPPSLVLEPCHSSCSFSALPALVATAGVDKICELRLYHCGDLLSVACLEALSHLTRLQVLQCPELQQLQLCSSMELLLVEDCTQLKAIQPSADLAMLRSYCLRDVRVQGCPEMAQLPDLHLLKSLIRVQLGSSAMHQLSSLQQLQLGSSVEHVLLESCQGLTSIQAPSAPSALQQVTVKDCPSLTHLPDLGCLIRIQLQQCNALRCLTFGSSLEQLVVKDCQELREVPEAVAGVGSEPPYRLLQLRLHNCPALEALPDMGRLGNLTQLEVHGCHELRLLQPGTSLKQLLVTDCGSLSEIEAITAPAAAAAAAAADAAGAAAAATAAAAAAAAAAAVLPCGHQQSERQQHQEQHTAPALAAALPAMQLTRLAVVKCPSLGMLRCLKDLPCLEQVMYHPSNTSNVQWQKSGCNSGCPMQRASKEQAGASGMVQFGQRATVFSILLGLYMCFKR